MSSALVLGDHGSGLTTFVGLLYTAQVRYGTEASDTFRFHADRESIQMLQEIYGALGEGRFPDVELDWDHHPLTFLFGFRRGSLGGIGRSSDGDSGAFDSLRIQVGGLPIREVAELREHDAILEDSVRRLLRSPVILPLVDATWLSADPADIRGLPMHRYDGILSRTLDLLGKFLAGDAERRNRRMFPVFVVTKFDRIAPEVLQGLGAPSGPTDRWSADARATFGRRLLDRFLPDTNRFLSNSRGGKLRIDAPAWFFSGVRTEEQPGADARIARRLRLPAGGWEPEYPFEEFRGLLELLGRLARHLPREVVE